MKYLAGFALALCLSAAGAPARADVPWRTGPLEPLLADARAHARLVLLDFGAAWCVPCQQLNTTVWNRADVTALVTRGYVPLQVDADGPEGTAMVARFHVTGLPTILVLRPDGTEVGRITGTMDPAAIVRTLTGYRQGAPAGAANPTPPARGQHATRAAGRRP